MPAPSPQGASAETTSPATQVYHILDFSPNVGAERFYMPSIRIDLTPQQKQALKQFADSKGIKNVSEYVRGLIRADMQAHGKLFHPDVEWGTNRYTQKQAQASHNKQALLFDLLAHMLPQLPLSIEQTQKVVMDYLIEHNQSDAYVEAMVICQSRGVVALLDWFGIPPVYGDATKSTIETLRIKSADED